MNEPDLPPSEEWVRRRRGLAAPVSNPNDPRHSAGPATSMTTIPGVGFQAPQPGTPRSAYAPPAGEPSLPPRAAPAPQAVPIRTTYGSGLVRNPLAQGYKGPNAPGAAQSAAQAGGYKDPRATMLKIPSQAELLATYNQLRARSPYMAAIWLKNLPHLYQEAVKQYFQNPAHGATGVRLRGMEDYTFQNPLTAAEPSLPPPVDWQLFQTPERPVAPKPAPPIPAFATPQYPAAGASSGATVGIKVLGPSPVAPRPVPAPTQTGTLAERQRAAAIASHMAKYKAAEAQYEKLLRAGVPLSDDRVASARAIMDVHKRGLEMLGVAVVENIAPLPPLSPQRDPILYSSQPAPSFQVVSGPKPPPLVAPVTQVPGIAPLTSTAPYADPGFQQQMQQIAVERTREQIEAMKRTLTPGMPSAPPPPSAAPTRSLLPLLAPFSQSYTGVAVTPAEVQGVVDVQRQWGAPVATAYAAVGFGSKAVDKAISAGQRATSSATDALESFSIDRITAGIMRSIEAPFVNAETALTAWADEAKSAATAEIKDQLGAKASQALTGLMGGAKERARLEQDANLVRGVPYSNMNAAQKRAADHLRMVADDMILRAAGMGLAHAGGPNPLADLAERFFADRISNTKREVVNYAKSVALPVLARYQGEMKNPTATVDEKTQASVKFVDALPELSKAAVNVAVDAALKDPAQAQADARARTMEELQRKESALASLKREMARGSDVAQEAQYARLSAEVKTLQKKVRA